VKRAAAAAKNYREAGTASAEIKRLQADIAAAEAEIEMLGTEIPNMETNLCERRAAHTEALAAVQRSSAESGTIRLAVLRDAMTRFRSAESVARRCGGSVVEALATVVQEETRDIREEIRCLSIGGEEIEASWVDDPEAEAATESEVDRMLAARLPLKGVLPGSGPDADDYATVPDADLADTAPASDSQASDSQASDAYQTTVSDTTACQVPPSKAARETGFSFM